MVVCSCHAVSDRRVAEVVAAGAARFGHVVRGTRAGTDCGGCLPRLRELCESYFAAAPTPVMVDATG